MATRAAARHHVDIPDAEGEFGRIAKGIANTLSYVEENPRDLKRLLQNSLRLAGLRSYRNPSAGELETWQAYVQVMQASSAIFAVALGTEGTVEIRFGEQTLEFPAGSTRGIADAGNWVTAFYFAIMCRDQARLNMLAAVPIELLRATGSMYDEYIYDWIATLQAYWSEDTDLPSKLRAAFEGTNPGNTRIAPADLMLEILFPPINLFYRFFDEQREEFNDTLAEALRLHDRFWDSEEDNRKTSRIGFIAAGPLAMACLAYDADFPIDVESDYLPEHILHRTWLGEFPT
ncbi:immunity 49 family protein [Nocardia jejuensis]|uniref:immunity 49 family protein n=1 Tax=Nocardia jejuensis TaxID=328049 RepID=UPI00082F2295|nr:immunity 49 family protein [Nocardia jejuensis]